MQIIKPIIEPFDKLLKPQQFVSGVNYRPMHFVVEQPVDERLLLYHTMTKALLLLTHDEVKQYRENPTKLPQLVAQWFLVPQEHDDFQLSQQIRQVGRLLQQNDGAITTYTIFTTMDCNARCFYCYEKGRPRIPMTAETAQRVADYIITHSKGHKVRLGWFGGEPLYNQHVITLICGRLQEAGIDYYSTMISNGYLFSDRVVQQAKDLWRLKKVQITLDGTEQIYNQSKNYIYKNVNAYQRVITNIHRLLAADIKVDIRLNIDLHNADNLSELVEELHSEFGQTKGLSVYLHELFELADGSVAIHQAATREAIFQRMKEIGERLVSYGLASQNSLKRQPKIISCMADNDRSITILPTGNIGKCEHYSEDHFIGHIDTGQQWDSNMVTAFRERNLHPECSTCLYEPCCIPLKLCEDRLHCFSEERDYHLWETRQGMLRTYHKPQNDDKDEDEHDEI